MNIFWSMQARSDLRAIRDFISRDSEYYALWQIKRLIERVEHIARSPMKGHPELSILSSTCERRIKRTTASSTR